MVASMGPPVSLKPRAQRGAYRTTDKSQGLWRCSNPLSLTCAYHGSEIEVPCGRWRTCPGCGRRMQWRLRQRFLAGIEKVPTGRHAMFFTLTFPEDRAPDEDGAHRALRSLVRRLRYRDQLGAYGWVLHRQKNGTLHYHGIAHMPWFDDDLKKWRELLEASGFGVQNKLVVAKPRDAGYCTRYISARLAQLSRLRRAYSFSRDFPRTDWAEARKLEKELDWTSDCEWMPTTKLHWLLRD